MKIDRKKQILDAATKSFSLFGYKATTMEQVAKIANVGKGTIYTFFTNKEELFSEIMNDLIKEMEHVAASAIQSDSSAVENLFKLLSGFIHFRTDHELVLKLTHEEREIGTLLAHEGIQRLEEAILQIIKDEVQRGIDHKELKPCDPSITAFVMFKLFKALVTDWAKRSKPLSEAQLSDLFQLYLMDGLARNE